MGTVTVPGNADLQRVIRKAAADPNKASYDVAAGQLECPDVTTVILTAARDAVVNKTDAINGSDRADKIKRISEIAIQAHHSAILTADAVYQAKLIEIQNARTLAQLDAITYP